MPVAVAEPIVALMAPLVAVPKIASARVAALAPVDEAEPILSVRPVPPVAFTAAKPSPATVTRLAVIASFAPAVDKMPTAPSAVTVLAFTVTLPTVAAAYSAAVWTFPWVSRPSVVVVAVTFVSAKRLSAAIAYAPPEVAAVPLVTVTAPPPTAWIAAFVTAEVVPLLTVIAPVVLVPLLCAMMP